jgi:hypothetical protein
MKALINFSEIIETGKKASACTGESDTASCIPASTECINLLEKLRFWMKKRFLSGQKDSTHVK